MSRSKKGHVSRTLSRRTPSPHTLEALDQRLLLSATLVVNTLDDETTPDDNLFSLREAVTQANTAPGPDTISFDATLTGSIKLIYGQLDIADDLTIAGPGVKRLAVSGNGLDRVFNIQDFNVSISNISITDGFAPLREDGGAIQNAGTLTINRVLFENNEAGYGGDTLDDPAPDGGLGGAIFNSKSLTISNSAFVDNFAGRGGNGYDDFAFGGSGGSGGSGGGIYNNATLICSNTTFAGNEAGFGGFGGDSTSGFGVGGNGGNGGSGGAIANNNDATLINVTITDNYSGFGGLSGQPDGRSGRDGIGGGIYNSHGTVTLANSLVADNDFGDVNPDVSGDFISSGHNLISITDGSSGWVASDIVGDSNAPIDAKLDTIKDNGGPTPTVALLAGSPAMNAADKALATSPTDQRGYARVYNRLPDIGAFETGSAYPADANHDGSVDFNDLVKLAQNYNVSDGTRTWEQGDFTGDGNVDFNDLVILAQNYNTTPAANDAAPPTGPGASPLQAPAPTPVSAESLLAAFQPITRKRPAPKAIFNVIKPIKPAQPAKPLKRAGH